MTSKLRPPNFLLSSGGDDIDAAANGNVNNSGRLSLSSYTSKCQQQLLLAVSKSVDDGSDNDDTITPDNQAKNNTHDDNNNSNRESSNEPSMEQCILLLEPHLSGFQRSCRQKDDMKDCEDGGGKKKKRRKARLDIEEEDDEVPPQLLRLARFFHYRWLPIKRALLRPVASTPTNDHDEPHITSSIEVGLKYRLRLAKACRRQGLVAAAEYEMLSASLDKVMNDVNEGVRNAQNDDRSDEDNLLERVRVALLRLPTDATINSSVTTSSSSQATAIAAWRHAKEMMLECCRYWEKNGINISKLVPSATSLEGDGATSSKELLSELGISKVVDWALTSWTALLLAQGIDCFTVNSSHTLTFTNSNDPIAKIESEFAKVLSNRSNSIGNNNDPNPFQLFAMAVSNRLNEILSSSSHLKQLSGIHLLSMARLLAFHSRDCAEDHLMTSIITCSAMKAGGMDLMDPLSRLLALYCCNISIVYGAVAPEDNLVGNTGCRTTAADLENRLCSKLNDGEFVDRVLALHQSGGEQSKQRGMALSRAKSFMGVIFTMTAHFIKCGAQN